MRSLFAEWDIRDTRNVILAIFIPLAISQVGAIFHFVSRAIIDLTLVVTTTYVDFLYFNASADGYFALAILFSFVIAICFFPFFLALMWPSVVRNAIRAAQDAQLPRQGYSRQKLRSAEGRRLFLVALAGLLGAAQIPLLYVPAYAIINFHRKLSALGPALSDEERNGLLADWARMKSQADYDAISKHINQLADLHYVKLPSSLR